MNEDLLRIGVPDALFVPIFLFLCAAAFPRIIRSVAPKHASALLKVAWLRMAFAIPGFIFATQSGPMDCHAYWRSPSEGFSFFADFSSLGSSMVEYLMLPFAWWLKLSFFSCFLPFAAFSAIGTILLGATLIKTNQGTMPRLGWLMLCLPNVIFWCSLPGKDVMMWFFGSLLLYGIFCMQSGIKTAFVLLFSMAGMFAFRPHVAVASMVAIIFVLIFAPKGTSWVSRHRIGILLLTFVSMAVALPYLKEYINVSDWTNLSEYSERFQQSGETYDASKEGEASSIDLTGASPVTRMFSFMYRPLFIDAHNTAALAASLENLFLLILSTITIRNRRLWAGLFMKDFTLSTPLYLWISGWIILANAGGNNLGLFARQKVQLMPFFILFICILQTAPKQPTLPRAPQRV